MRSDHLSREIASLSGTLDYYARSGHVMLPGALAPFAAALRQLVAEAVALELHASQMPGLAADLDPLPALPPLREMRQVVAVPIGLPGTNVVVLPFQPREARRDG